MRKIMKYIDKPLLIITIILFIFGLIMVFSASNVTAYMSHAVSPYNYFIKQSISNNNILNNNSNLIHNSDDNNNI